MSEQLKEMIGIEDLRPPNMLELRFSRKNDERYTTGRHSGS